VTVKLLLIRHGRVDFDSRRFRQTSRGRQWDPPLGEQGREQARRLTARLQLMEPPSLVLVSPFTRCRQTITPFLETSEVEPRIEEGVGEVYIGEWEGLSFEEIISEDEELARRFREQEAMFSMAPGGESGAELRERVVRVVEAGLATVEDGTVLVIAHGGVINAYLGNVMGIPHDMFFLPGNASINTVLVEGDRRDVKFLNDVRHLTDPAVFAPPAGVGEHAASDAQQGELR
jgi:probable phosphoglycerate mutase